MVIGSRAAGIALAGLCLWSMPSRRGDQRPLLPPDPTTVSLPDLTGAPGPSGSEDDDSYFYFHKANVTYSVAFADLDECRLYGLSSELSPVPPKFVPLGAGAERVGAKRNPYVEFFPQYGIVGSLIVGLLISSAEDDAALATERRCMAYKGYGRYGLPRALWKKLDK